MVERRGDDADQRGPSAALDDHPQRLTPAERTKRWREQNPEKAKALRARWRAKAKAEGRAWAAPSYSAEQRQIANLRQKYGLTPDEYDQMSAAQGDGCAICGGVNDPPGRRLAIDHDHGTGQVRGLLCYRCNSAIGLFKDDVTVLRRAILYLESR